MNCETNVSVEAFDFSDLLIEIENLPCESYMDAVRT